MKQRSRGKAVFDLIEEAVHRLRSAPAPVLAAYYTGAIPFVLGWLYFWTDMSRSPFAGDHLTASTLALTGLFLWMKFWQVIFARGLRAHIAAEPAPRWSLRRSLRMFLTQAFIQPTGLFVIPLSLLPVLPAPWVYSFYQNVTMLDDGGPDRVRELLKKSRRQTRLWPGQNVLVLAIMAGFGFYVFLNWVVAGLVLPHLMKMLFGIESVFTQSTFSMLNTTFFAGAAGLTYLCVDPILKTIYALRCFYGESLVSGEDLRAELNTISTRGASLAAVIAISILASSSPLHATENGIPPIRPSVSSAVKPADLNRAISETIHQNKYTWRMPREKFNEPDAKEGAIARFFDKIGSTLRQWARDVSHWLDEWLRKLSRRTPVEGSSGPAGYGWIESLQVLLYGLVIVVLLALAVLLYRIWRDRHRPDVVGSEPINPVPDLRDENVGADELPEDSWTRLAHEFLDRGELRLALRAFYFASLSHLATRNLISIARFKSNRDYERELSRRGHSFPGLVLMFGDNLLSFESIWYGLHEANRELVDRFAANVEKMKAAG